MARIVPATPPAIEEAVALLRAGSLVAFPTETVYGLGADASNPEAVALIYQLKGRPRGHPLIVHLPDREQMGKWAVPTEEAQALARRFWPGPLTLVLRRAQSVPDTVTGGQATVALRMPQHPVAAALLSAFGGGVAAPSANRFGRISPTSAAHVAAEFEEELLVLDGGSSEVGLESTILDLSSTYDGGPPRLLRPGGVPLAEIEEFLGGGVLLPHEPAASVDEGAVPRVPGSLTSHYAAVAPTRLVSAESLVSEALAAGSEAAVMALQSPPQGFGGRWSVMPAEPGEYGRQLYATLRELDLGQPSEILIENVPQGAAWLAVRDRLTRAAAE